VTNDPLTPLRDSASRGQVLAPLKLILPAGGAFIVGAGLLVAGFQWEGGVVMALTLIAFFSLITAWGTRVRSSSDQQGSLEMSTPRWLSRGGRLIMLIAGVLIVVGGILLLISFIT
jgi:hypothetical protein